MFTQFLIGRIRGIFFLDFLSFEQFGVIMCSTGTECRWLDLNQGPPRACQTTAMPIRPQPLLVLLGYYFVFFLQIGYVYPWLFCVFLLKWLGVSMTTMPRYIVQVYGTSTAIQFKPFCGKIKVLQHWTRRQHLTETRWRAQGWGALWLRWSLNLDYHFLQFPSGDFGLFSTNFWRKARSHSHTHSRT